MRWSRVAEVMGDALGSGGSLPPARHPGICYSGRRATSKWIAARARTPCRMRFDAYRPASQVQQGDGAADERKRMFLEKRCASPNSTTGRRRRK